MRVYLYLRVQVISEIRGIGSPWSWSFRQLSSSLLLWVLGTKLVFAHGLTRVISPTFY